MTLGLPSWSAVAADNNQATPYGISGTDAVSTIDNWGRQVMDSVKEFYIDSQWASFGLAPGYVAIAPVYVNATQFTIAGNITAAATPYRKIKLYGTIFGTRTGIILSSSYGGSDTTITVLMDEGVALTSNISQVFFGIVSASFPALSSVVTMPSNVIFGGNMDMNPWQRGTSFTAISSGSMSADGFKWFNSSSAVVDIQNQADSPAITLSGNYGSTCLSLSVSTADASTAAGDYAGIFYHVEGYDAACINHGFYTLSFWVKSSTTGTYCVSFRNSGADRSYVATYTINTANTWEYKSIPIGQASSSSSGTWNYTTGIGLRISFTLMCGTTYQTTAGQWNNGDFLGTSAQTNLMGTVSNNFKLQFVSLTKGISSGFWIQEYNRAEVLAKAQRYYSKTYDASTAPGTSTLAGAYIGVPISINGQAMSFQDRFPATMRAAPTITIYGSTGVINTMRDTSGGVNVSATTTTIGTSGCAIYNNVSLSSALIVLACHVVRDATL